MDNEDRRHHNNAGVLLPDVLPEARMEGRTTRHGGHDADAGKHPQYSFAQCEHLTTSGFPAVRMEKSATIFKEIAIYAIYMDSRSDS